ncbi:MAG: hypothetical protein KKE96_05720 [Candidatus Altiarchaeota archaeon]|nr:hypothetical protein [Candidatus Altiarchaeota archaeon]
MKKPNLKKALVLFSVYVVLTLFLAQMTIASAYCKELEISTEPSEGDILIEYCSHPLEFEEGMNKWGYFVYTYLPEEKEIVLDIDDGPQLELENLQDQAAASHTTGDKTITVFEPGAFLLWADHSEELELSSEDPTVFISGTDECGVLVEHNFIAETLLQVSAEQAPSSIAMQMEIAAAMLELQSVYAAAVIGGVAGGGGTSCDIVAGSSGDLGGESGYRLGKFIQDKSAYDMKNAAGETKNFLDMMGEFTRRAKAEPGIEGINVMVYIYGSMNYFFPSTEGKPKYARLGDIDLAVTLVEAVPDHLIKGVDAAGNNLIPEILRENGFKVEHVFLNTEVVEFTLYEGGSPKTLQIHRLTLAYGIKHRITDVHVRGKVFPDYATIVGNSESIDVINTAFRQYPETADIRAAFSTKTLVGASDLLSSNPKKAARRIALSAKVVDTPESRAIADDIVIKFDKGAIDAAYLESMMEDLAKIKWELTGLCCKLGKSFTTRDAYTIENILGHKYNLLDILYEALKEVQKTTGQQGVIAIEGSSQYLYASPEKIKWKYTEGVDLLVIDVDGDKFIDRVVEEFYKRDFEVSPGDEFDRDFRVNVLEDGKTVAIDFDPRAAPKGEVFANLRNYPEGMTFIGDSEQIDDITSRIEAQKSGERVKLKHGLAVSEANTLALAKDFEGASRRLIKAAWIMDAYALSDGMYAEFKAEFDGARDFQSFYDKYRPIVEALKLSSQSALMDSQRARINYMRRIDGYTIELDDALYNLDMNKVDRIIAEAGQLRAEVNADAALSDKDRVFFRGRIDLLEEMVSKHKAALLAAPDMKTLEASDAAKEKVAEAKIGSLEFTGKIAEDGTLILEEVTKETEAAKAKFDALPEGEKARWADQIRAKRIALAAKLERLVDFSKKLMERVDKSKYARRVYQARGWGREKLNKVGLTRFEKIGRSTSMLIMGAAILQILAEDAGPNLQVIGENTDNPWFIYLGWVLEVTAKILHIGFIAMIAISVVVTIFVGGLSALVLLLVVIVILFVVIGYIIKAALKLLWCNYLNRTLMGDSLCMLIYGPSPITMEVRLQGSSGNCMMNVLWRGHTRMICT